MGDTTAGRGVKYPKLPPESEKKVPNQHKIFTSMLAGGIAGAVAKTSIAPFDRTKIIFQVSNQKFSIKAALKFLITSIRNEGVLSLWRGNSATMIRIVPYAAIQFTSHEQYKLLLAEEGQRHLPPLKKFLAGSLAGITSTSATYPLDLVRARMAVTKKSTFSSVYEVVIKTYKTEGMLTLYRGYVPTVIGAIPYAGISFLTYETLKQWHVERTEREISIYNRYIYGAVAGAVSQSCTYPLDIVRRRMQTAGVIDGRANSYQTILGTFKQITLEEGFIRGMYKGLSMNWIKGPIAVGTSFATFETVQQFLRRFKMFHE